MPLSVLTTALEPLGLRIGLRSEEVRRAGLSAVRVHVEVPAEKQPHRTWADIRALLGRLSEPLRSTATTVFTALAEAEGVVHGVPAEDVHFHEVGALDAVADVVAVCAGINALALEQLVASPVALGGGYVQTTHGRLPVPGPAVLALLARAGAPGRGGPDEEELATPTGVALVTSLVTGFGMMPSIRPLAIGTGAGGIGSTGPTWCGSLWGKHWRQGRAAPGGMRCGWRPTWTTSIPGHGQP